MNTPTTIKIGKNEFIITKFMAYDSLKIQREIISLLGPSIGKILGSIKQEKGMLDSEIDGTGLSEAIKDIFEKLTEEKYFELIGTLLENVQVKFKQDNKVIVLDFSGDLKTKINMFFNDNPLEIYELLFCVIKENFSPFLQKIRSTLAGLKIGIFDTLKE